MRMTMTDDLAQYARALVGARIPELTVAELIAALTGPDAALPAEITGEVLDVLTAFVPRPELSLARFWGERART
jgi:hypothetical protein